MTADTLLPPSQARTRYSPTNPAPLAIRCPTPGCFRRRNPGGDLCRKLRPVCQRCRAGDARPRMARRPQEAVVLTRTVRADVWPLASAGADSRVMFVTRDVPAGATARVLPGRAAGDGDAVLELDECQGRFVCPADAMRETGGGR